MPRGAVPGGKVVGEVVGDPVEIRCRVDFWYDDGVEMGGFALWGF